MVVENIDVLISLRLQIEPASTMRSGSKRERAATQGYQLYLNDAKEFHLRFQP